MEKKSQLLENHFIHFQINRKTHYVKLDLNVEHKVNFSESQCVVTFHADLLQCGVSSPQRRCGAVAEVIMQDSTLGCGGLAQTVHAEPKKVWPGTNLALMKKFTITQVPGSRRCNTRRIDVSDSHLCKHYLCTIVIIISPPILLVCGYRLKSICWFKP